MKVKTIAAALLLLSTGCSLLVPYDDEFSCPGSRDYGKCTDVNGAYEEAVYGTPAPDTGSPDKDEKEKVSHAKLSHSPPMTGEDHYRDAQYRELAGVIEDPETPVVVRPKALRTLILSYDTDGTLWMPRYVYYFANDAKFIFSEGNSVATEPRMVFPNGGE